MNQQTLKFRKPDILILLTCFLSLFALPAFSDSGDETLYSHLFEYQDPSLSSLAERIASDPHLARRILSSTHGSEINRAVERAVQLDIYERRGSEDSAQNLWYLDWATETYGLQTNSYFSLVRSAHQSSVEGADASSMSVKDLLMDHDPNFKRSYDQMIDRFRDRAEAMLETRAETIEFEVPMNATDSRSEIENPDLFANPDKMERWLKLAKAHRALHFEGGSRTALRSVERLISFMDQVETHSALIEALKAIVAQAKLDQSPNKIRDDYLSASRLGDHFVVLKSSDYIESELQKLFPRDKIPKARLERIAFLLYQIDAAGQRLYDPFVTEVHEVEMISGQKALARSFQADRELDRIESIQLLDQSMRLAEMNRVLEMLVSQERLDAYRAPSGCESR